MSTAVTDLGFEPDRTRAWLATPAGSKVAEDNPALQRMADVVLIAMTAAGGDDPDLQLAVLVKVQAMVVASMVRGAPADRVRAVLERVGPAVQDEAVGFLKALKRDMRRRVGG